MKNFLHNFLREVVSIVLTQESGNKINTSIYKFRNKHKWIFRLIYSTANDEEIFNNILQKLEGRFEILMVHSSLNGMVPMYTGSLNKLLALLVSYCEQNNITLAMPTFFEGSNWEAKEYYENGKHNFNVRKTVSQMGLLSEIFRRMPNVKRSIHPTHSICALGRLANELTKNHHLAKSTFGEGTPFDEVIKYRTIILGIGTKSPQPLTQVNAAPDIMKSEFPINLYSEFVPVKCVDEMENTFTYYLPIRKRELVIDRKTVKKLVKSSVTEWRFKGIPFLLAQADVITDAIIEAAKNGHTIYKTKK